MADLDWSKYSEPEPDLAPYLEKIPHLVFTPDSISETRKLSRERVSANHPPRLGVKDAKTGRRFSRVTIR